MSVIGAHDNPIHVPLRVGGLRVVSHRCVDVGVWMHVCERSVCQGCQYVSCFTFDNSTHLLDKVCDGILFQTHTITLQDEGVCGDA